MKFNLVFIFYSCLLGILVGVVASLFLGVVNALIHLVWTTLPETFDSTWYPLWMGATGGVLIGLFQKYIGDYPKTMHETLREFQETGRVTYEGAIIKNSSAALLVLTFGASLGPEAALVSILGGLMTWIGDRMTWTIHKKEQLLELGIGAMLATIFYAPFVGVSEAIEEGIAERRFQSKLTKALLYGITTACGILAFTLLNRLFPSASVFGISTPEVNWTREVFYFLVPAILIGAGFGAVFLLLGRWTDQLAIKYQSPLGLAISAGLTIGLFGIWSPYFLFSGEHELLDFSKEALDQSILFLVLLALGKALLTNICFSFGWRGGKIFPAIFSSTSIGFAFAVLFPYTPGLLVAVAVAASCTVILKQPFVTATLLLFLFPLQFFPFILFVAILIKQISIRIEGSIK